MKPTVLTKHTKFVSIKAILLLFVANIFLACEKKTPQLNNIEKISVKEDEYLYNFRITFNNKWDYKISKKLNIDTLNTISIKFFGNFRSIPKYSFFIKKNKIFFVQLNEFSEFLEKKIEKHLSLSEYIDVIKILNDNLHDDKKLYIYDGIRAYISECFGQKKAHCMIKQPQTEIILLYLSNIFDFSHELCCP